MFYYYGPADNKEEALKRLLVHHDYITVDTETVSLTDDTCIGIGIAIGPAEAFYFPCYNGERKYSGVHTENLNEVKRVLADPFITKIFFNSMFDLDIIDYRLGINAYPFIDVSPAVQVQGFHNDLATLVGNLLATNHQEIRDILPKGKSMLDIPIEKVANKCLWDCMHTHQLAMMMRLPEWKDNNPLIWEDRIGRKYDVNARMLDCYWVDIKLMPVLRRMAARGLGLRQDKLEDWMFKLSDQCRDYEKTFEQYGVNIRSNEQVGNLLASRGNFLPFTKTYQLKVDEDALKKLSDPLAVMLVGKGPDYDPDRIIGYRELDKLRTTYIMPWQLEDRAYTHFRVDLATGRVASGGRHYGGEIHGRNLQNVPPKIREVFEPNNRIWTWFDYSQIEMRIFAYRSQDPVMVEAYANGDDIHWISQQALFPGVAKEHTETRTRSKTFNFAMIFDAEDFVLGQQAGMATREVSPIRERWFQKFVRARPYQREQGDFAMNNGWAETEFGRRMGMPNWDRGEKHVRTCGINYPVQGTAADIIKRTMLIIADQCSDDSLQVHDEELLDGDYEEMLEDFRPKLEHIHPELWTPLKIEKGEIWS